MSPASGSPTDSRIPATAAYLLGFVTGALILWRHPDVPFVRFHAWQSILFSASLAVAIAALDFVPLLGLGLAFVLAGGGVVLWFVLCVQAYRGRWFRLPLLGDIAMEWAGVGHQQPR